MNYPKFGFRLPEKGTFSMLYALVLVYNIFYHWFELVLAVIECMCVNQKMSPCPYLLSYTITQHIYSLLIHTTFVSLEHGLVGKAKLWGKLIVGLQIQSPELRSIAKCT